jgi:uncharacterized protein (DUF302 family)
LRSPPQCGRRSLIRTKRAAEHAILNRHGSPRVHDAGRHQSLIGGSAMRRIALAACLLAFAASPALAETPSLIAKKSPHDFTTTVTRLEGAIAKRGAAIAAKVDHAAAARVNGLELKPATVVIFGNPKLGTPLMQSSPTAGLDLPMRVLVWQDATGAVMVGYWPPAALATSHGIKDRDQVLKTMTGALDAITNEAVAR